MKYCEEYAALLDLFVDGELPAAEMEQVRNHLEDCPGCRAYVDDVLAIRAGFLDVEDTVVPEGFAEGVMERIRESSAREGKVVELKRRSTRRWAGTIAALAACCALVILVRTGPGGGLNGVSSGEEQGEAVLYNCMEIDGAEESLVEEHEAGVAAQTVLPEAAPEAPAEAAPKRSASMRTAEMDDAELQKEEKIALAAAPEAAMDGAIPEEALCLTAEETGGWLEDLDPIWEKGEERLYELSAEEYRALLEALGRQEELPEEAEGSFLVLVTGPFL